MQGSARSNSGDPQWIFRPLEMHPRIWQLSSSIYFTLRAEIYIKKRQNNFQMNKQVGFKNLRGNNLGFAEVHSDM